MDVVGVSAIDAPEGETARSPASLKVLRAAPIARWTAGARVEASGLVFGFLARHHREWPEGE